MITNERQYGITRAKANRFRDSIAHFEQGITGPDVLQVAQLDAMQSQLSELEESIADYESLRAGDRQFLEVDTIEDLPLVLIQARVAAGLSQRELGEKIGLKEQQVQRYESTLYRSASMQRIADIARILGVEITNEAILNANPDTTQNLLTRIEDAGVSQDFVFGRLLPSELSSFNLAQDYKHGLLALLIRRLGKVFGWSPEQLLSGEVLTASPTAFAGLAYKAPKNVVEKKKAAYTVYAHYLALAILEGIDEEPQAIPKDPIAMHDEVVDAYGRLTLETVLQYAWNHGIAVLPLADPGAFHGACWRIGGRSVIVLKQRTGSQARWLFDLIHEICHTQQCLDEEDRAVIEEADPLTLSEDDLEIEANDYAGNVVLRGRAEELVQLCVERASENIPFLKRAAKEIAREQDVDLSSLANYLAFRLSLQDINWWGASANLQESDSNPYLIARDVFIERCDISRLGKFDRELIINAMKY